MDELHIVFGYKNWYSVGFSVLDLSVLALHIII